MSYNIHSGKDQKGNDKIGAMADFIKSSEVDIVGLQEVDSVCTRSGQVDQAAVLACKAGMHHVFSRHFALQGGAYGLALLSKYPICEVELFRLPIASDTGRRVIMLMADVLINDKQKIKVVNVHLDYRSQASREQQVRLIVERLKACELPIVFVGDLNAQPRSPEIVALQRGLQLIDTHRETDYTFPVNHPNRKIDYILVDASAEVTSARVLDVPYSDHLPIISEVIVNRKLDQ